MNNAEKGETALLCCTIPYVFTCAIIYTDEQCRKGGTALLCCTIPCFYLFNSSLQMNNSEKAELHYYVVQYHMFLLVQFIFTG